MNPSKIPWLHVLLCVLFFTGLSLNSVLSAPTKISYADHCASIIPEPTTNNFDPFMTFRSIQFRNGYYRGGNKILYSNSPQESHSLSFRTLKAYDTEKDGLFKIGGSLILRGQNSYYYLGNVSYGQSDYYRSTFNRRNSVSFRLHGFWSESSGNVCMVGIGSTHSKEGNLLVLEAVLKLSNLKNSSSVTSLVSGTLESLSSANDLAYFDPISILMLPQMNYEYTFASKEFGEGCSGGSDGSQSLSLGSPLGRSFCSVISRTVSELGLKYASDCNSSNCSPFGGDIGYLPRVISLNVIDCLENEKRIRVMVKFGGNSYLGFYQTFSSNTTLIGEGLWDTKKNQLCVVACRFLDITESLANARVGDCSTRLSLRFPAIWSIRETSSMLGQIWRNKTVNDSSHFERITFRSTENQMEGVPGLKYNYTEIERVRKLCPKNKNVKNNGEKHTNGYSHDMRFDMWVKTSEGKNSWGYATPLAVGDRLFEQYSYAISPSGSMFPQSAVHENWSNNGPVNISYKIGIRLQSDIILGGEIYNISSSSNEMMEISAEGIYDAKTGDLCMVGCRNLGPNNHSSTIDSMDCEILVNFQLPVLNSKKNGGYIKGSIKSLRKKSDPLYFKSFDSSSAAYNTVEAKQSIGRMDMEITMVLISNTLSCVFIGLQLFHVKKHPEFLPFISLVMLLITTLGHMIPLVLNFEALFLQTRDRQNVLLGSGGWLEVNEVIIRVVTMVAFLLQFRLLQLSWSAKSGDGSQKDLWFTEKMTLLVSLAAYAAGALISLLVINVMLSSSLISYQQHSFWQNLRSYTGLVLDGFLLPQILLNVFRNSKENALSRSFYLGTTFVRLLPHGYDLYRAHSYARHFDQSYIYANPGADFYSTAWDVIIPLGAMLFAAIIYLQQSFGGRFILPRRFREVEVYEKIPAVTEA